MALDTRDHPDLLRGRPSNGAPASRASTVGQVENPPRVTGSGAWGRDLNETVHYIGSLVSRLGNNISEMLGLRAELLKEELKESGRTLARDSALLVSGAVLGLFAVGVLSLALVSLVAWLLPFTLLASLALGALIVGVAYAAIAGVLAWYGLDHLKKRGVAPERSIEEMEKDKQWVSEIGRT